MHFTPMRILLVNDFPRGGGAEAHVAMLAALLGEGGHEVEILAGSRARIHVAGRLWNPFARISAARAIRRFRPDVVHVHKHNLFWGTAPFLESARAGLPVVSTQHDFSGICPEGWMVDADGAECGTGFGSRCWGSRCLRSDRLSMDLYRRANLVRLLLQEGALRRSVSLFLAPSNLLVRWLERRYAPVPARLQPSCLPAGGPRAGGGDGPLVVFAAARLEREKGLDLLLAGAARVPGVEVRIAGSGSREEALRRLCASLGIEDRVRWLGLLPSEQVRAECRRAHLVAQASLWIEGGGDATLAILEGMAEGCAAASSRFGTEPDIVEPGSNGWLLERGSVEDWERVLREAASDPSRCLRMGEEGRRKIASTRSPARCLELVEAAYRFAIAGEAGMVGTVP